MGPDRSKRVPGVKIGPDGSRWVQSIQIGPTGSVGSKGSIWVQRVHMGPYGSKKVQMGPDVWRPMFDLFIYLFLRYFALFYKLFC